MLRLADLGPVAFIYEDLIIQRMSDNSTTRSSQTRLRAQQYILKKHAKMLTLYPDIPAHLHNRIAGALGDGHYKSIEPHEWAVWQAQAKNLRYLLHAAYLQPRALVPSSEGKAS